MADLRPMDLGEILDGALTIFRRHVALFVKLGIAALWLPVALTVYIQLAGGRQQHIVLTILAVGIQYFAGLFLTAGAIRVISDSYLGRPAQLGDALALGASKIWPLFLVGLGKGIVLGLIAVGIGVVVAVLVPAFKAAGGALAAVVLLAVGGGLWFLMFVACGYAVTTPVVVLEQLSSSFDAFGRSWDLTRSFKRKVFGIAVVAYLLVSLPLVVLSVFAAFFVRQSPPLGHALEILAAVLPVGLTPLLACVFTLMYYDLRVRREAFDLQILSQQLGIV